MEPTASVYGMGAPFVRVLGEFVEGQLRFHVLAGLVVLPVPVPDPADRTDPLTPATEGEATLLPTVPVV